MRSTGKKIAKVIGGLGLLCLLMVIIWAIGVGIVGGNAGLSSEAPTGQLVFFAVGVLLVLFGVVLFVVIEEWDYKLWEP